MDVPGRQVLDGSTALILMFDTDGLMWAGRERRLNTTADLDARLLVGTDHVLVCPEWLALPAAGVQVEHRAGPFQKVRIARENPVPIPPWAQGVGSQNSPNAATRGSDVVGTQSIGYFQTEFAEAVATQWQVAVGGTFARQRHHQGTGGGFDDRWPAAAWVILEPVTALDHEASQPATDRRSARMLLLGQGATAQPSRAGQDQSGSTDQPLWRRPSPHPGLQLADFGGGQLNRGSASSHNHLLAAHRIRLWSGPGRGQFSRTRHLLARGLGRRGTLASVCLPPAAAQSSPGYQPSCRLSKLCWIRAKPRAALRSQCAVAASFLAVSMRPGPIRASV